MSNKKILFLIKKNTLYNKKVKGLTLIELLIVVAIVSILSVVVLTGLNNARGRSNRSSFLKEVSTASAGLSLMCGNGNLPNPAILATTNVTWGDGSTASCGPTGTGNFCISARNNVSFGATAANACTVYVGPTEVFSNNNCTTSVTSATCPSS